MAKVLCALLAMAYCDDMDGMTLPPELERFAEQAVAAGRYRDMSEVVAAGVSLLRHQEDARADFVALLEAAEAESDHEGWHSAEDVHAEMTDLIEGARRAKG